MRGSCWTERRAGVAVGPTLVEVEVAVEVEVTVEVAVGVAVTVEVAVVVAVTVEVAVLVAVEVAVAVAVAVALAVGVGLFCVASPFRVTVAELFPLVAPLVMAMVPSSVPGPWGRNTASTTRLPLAPIVVGMTVVIS